MTERPLTWLQLGGLHLRAEKTFAYDIALTRLIDFLKSITSSGELYPDFIFCTGDVAYSGRAKEYATAQEFVNRLSEASRLPLSRIFTVPGNHDFNRTRRRSHFRAAIDSDADAERFFSSPEDCEIANRPFQDYFNFEEEVFGRTWLRNHLLATEKVRGTNIAVVGLNSALFADASTPTETLVIGRSTVEKALTAAERRAPDYTFVLMHHPPSLLASFERESVRRALSQRADFVLYSNVHREELGLALSTETIFVGTGSVSSMDPSNSAFLAARIDNGWAVVDQYRFDATGAGRWTLNPIQADGRAIRSRPSRSRPRVDSATPQDLSRYPFDLHRYLRHLDTEVGSVVLGGLGRLHAPTLRLDEIFVPPVIENAEGSALASAADLKQELDVKSILREQRRVLLVGPPGSGKTTFLSWLALSCGRELQSPASLRETPRWIPVYVRLRELSRDVLSAAGPNALDSIAAKTLGPFGAQEEWVENAIRRGEILFLLDGFDEVSSAEEGRNDISASIGRLVSSHPRAPVVLASRVAGSAGLLEQPASAFAIYHLRPFSSEQVSQFVRAAYRSLGFDRGRLDAAVEDLLRSIESAPFLRELSSTPLLLWIMVLTAWNSGSLPDRRVDLYSNAVRILTSTWDLSKGIEDRYQLDQRDTIPLLNALALAAHTRRSGSSGFDLRELRSALSLPLARHLSPSVISKICERTGIITYQNRDRWRFTHLSFQEFLSAQAILAKPKPVLALGEHLSDPWWREVIRFAITSAVQNDTTQGARLFYELVRRATDHASRSKSVESLGVLASSALDIEDLNQFLNVPEAKRLKKLSRSLIMDEAQPGSLWSRIQLGRLIGWFDVAATNAPETVVVPAGPFVMGSRDPTAPQVEKPARTVYVSTFRLCIHPITNAQFLRFIESGAYTKDRYWVGGVGQRTDHRALLAECQRNPSDPVTNISWFEAEAYCRWLNECAPPDDGGRWRLPTEAEWEKAARGAGHLSSTETERTYPWGERWSREKANGAGVHDGVTPVGIFPSGRGPYGAFDQVGNVAEWCQDGLWKYGPDGLTDPLGMTSSAVRVARGGDWASPQTDLRISTRAYHRPTERSSRIGFRCVISAITPVPTRPPNPFRPGIALPEDAPPPGRLEMVAGLTARIAQTGSSVVLGPRRSGKTSILRYLAATLGDRQTVRFIDLQGFPCRTPDVMAASLEPSIQDYPNPAEQLRRLLSRETSPVILLDELGRLRDVDVNADPNVFEWLRSLGQSGVSLVLAGTVGDWEEARAHDALKPGSSFTNILKPVTLGPLVEGDALNFLVDTAPDDVPMNRDTTAKWMVEMTGGWPFYLQVVAHAFVEEVRAGTINRSPSQGDVRQIYEKSLLDEYEFIFRQRWLELPFDARRILLQQDADQFSDAKLLSPADIAHLERHGLYDQRKGWLIALDTPFCDWFRSHRRGLSAASAEEEQS